MGDLVGSSQAPRKRQLHALFNRVVARANERFADQLASPLTITLGDEFQGLTRSLSKAFEINHFVRMKLLAKRVDSRLVLGTAVLDTPVNPDRAWNMMGKGLAEARSKLNDKKDFNSYRFSFPEDETLEILLDALGRSLTQVETGWTDTQRQYVMQAMAHPDEPRSELARRLGISPNSLFKVLRAAGFQLYSQQLAAARSVLERKDERRERK